MHKPHTLFGITYILISVFFLSLHDVLVKSLTQHFPVTLLVWARYGVLFIVVFFAFAPSMRSKLLETSRPWENIIRGCLLVVTTCFGFAGFKYAPLAEVTAVFFISPLLVLLLAHCFLKEKISKASLWTVILGFLGVLLIIRPGGAIPSVAIIFVSISACGFSVYQILTRRLSSSESTLTMLFYTALAGTVGMVPAALFLFDTPLPSMWQALQIFAMGVLFSLGQLFFIRAFQYAQASALSPFMYCQLIFATLFGWLFYDQLPDKISMLGIIIIASSSMFTAFSGSSKKQ